MKKIKVGVLMGGMSIEKEVSFNSGRTVCDHLDSTLYEIIPLFQTINNQLFILPWSFLHRGKISDFKNRLATEAKQIKWDNLKSHINFLYIATHGRYAEDGTLQGFLEILGIPYLGAKVLGSALGMHKTRQKELLQMAGISVPNGITIYPHEVAPIKNNSNLLDEKLKKQKLSLPLVIKPNQEGSSLGVTVVFKKEELITALEKACTIHPKETQPVLIEEKIEGMEYSCITLFDKTGNPLLLPPTEVIHEAGSHFHDYTQKYMPGRSTKFTPARTDEKILQTIQKTCTLATTILEFKTISRIDGFVKKDGTVVIVDPNSLSGMAPSSFFFNQAAEIGMSHTDLINHLIEVELQTQGIAVKKEIKETKEDDKLRVVVLLGGDTNERETSLDSGRNICYKLSPHKYKVIPVFVDAKRELYPLNQKLLVHNATKEIEHDLNRSTKINWHDLPNIADFVFIGLHGGVGENGSVQGTLEMLKLPYNGSGVMASALCIDKHKTNNFLKQKGFSVPENYLITKQEWKNNKEESLKSILDQFPFPVVVKPHNDGCSVGVSLAETKKELLSSLEIVFNTTQANALIEEFIEGMELTVGVVGNETPQALPPSQALSTEKILSIEEKFLPGAGENQTPALLPKEAIKLVQTTMVNAYKAIGCSGYARIDCFYQTAQQSPTKKDRVIIIEINNLPGMTPATCIFHQAAEIGIKPMDFVDLIVSFGLQKYKGSHNLLLKEGQGNEKNNIFIINNFTESLQYSSRQCNARSKKTKSKSG